MRISAIPAQVTTVEDRIVGNLNFKQVILLIAPLFNSILLFFSLPKFGFINLYKVILILIFAVISGILAIRIKDRLVIEWVILRLRYHSRPRIYKFSQNELNEDELLNKYLGAVVLNKLDSKRLTNSQKHMTRFVLVNSTKDSIYKISKDGGLVLYVH
jgi:hypothetical protein